MRLVNKKKEYEYVRNAKEKKEKKRGRESVIQLNYNRSFEVNDFVFLFVYNMNVIQRKLASIDLREWIFFLLFYFYQIHLLTNAIVRNATAQKVFIQFFVFMNDLHCFGDFLFIVFDMKYEV